MLVGVCSLGQSEILNWLIEQRNLGVEDYFTPKEVYEGLVESGCLENGNTCFRNGRIHRQLLGLADAGLIECEWGKNVMRDFVVFRAKKRVV